MARGANAAADFAANRRILLPDFRDRVSRGKGGSTSLGETGGADTVTIGQTNLPSYTLPDTLGVNLNQSGGNVANRIGGVNNVAVGGGTSDVCQSNGDVSFSPVITGSVSSGGGGIALDVKPRFIVKTKIIKL